MFCYFDTRICPRFSRMFSKFATAKQSLFSSWLFFKLYLKSLDRRFCPRIMRMFLKLAVSILHVFISSVPLCITPSFSNGFRNFCKHFESSLPSVSSITSVLIVSITFAGSSSSKAVATKLLVIWFFRFLCIRHNVKQMTQAISK